MSTPQEGRNMLHGYSPIARSLFAMGALLGVVSCSGAGASESGSITSPVPAAPAAVSIATSSASTVSTASTVSSAVSAGASEDVTAADIAALAAPKTEDVAEPATDAIGAAAWGHTVVGSYHGLIKGWTNGEAYSGALRLTVDGSIHSFGGSGVATEYGTGKTLSFTLNGSVVEFYPHGEAYDMTATSSAGCPASGTARRWAHVFLGVLQSQGCGFNPVPTTYYFKVHPNN